MRRDAAMRGWMEEREEMHITKMKECLRKGSKRRTADHRLRMIDDLRKD